MKKRPVYGLFILALLLTTLVAACAQATPTPTPTPTTPSPKPSPVISPTPTPSPTIKPTSTPVSSPTPTASPAPGKVYKIKFAVYWPEGLVYSNPIKWWASEVIKRTGGRVNVEMYWASALGSATEQLDVIGTGIAQAGVFGSGYFPSRLPLTGGLELPYLAQSLWIQTKAIEEMYGKSAKLRKEFQQNDVIYMANNMSGSEPLILSNKEVRTLDELQGLKIRAYGRLGWVYDRLGASPVGIAFSEIYQGMQRGTLEAATGVAPGGVYGAKLNEVSKYITVPGMGCFVFNPIVMNLSFWNSLPDDIKGIITQINADLADQSIQLVAEPEFKVMDQLRSEGKTVYVLPPDEAKKWKDLVIPGLYDAWIEEMTKAGTAGAADFLKEYQEVIAKYAPIDKWPKFK